MNKVTNNDDADAGISLLSGPIFVTVSTFCLAPAGFCFLSPPWDSGMPNFHLLAATASVSLDITPERKGTEGGSL